MTEQWLSINEYARTFDVSDMTVRRRIKQGRLHAVLKEGKYFIPVELDRMGQPIKPTRNQATDREGMDFETPEERIAVGSPRPVSVVKPHPSAHRTLVESRPATPQPPAHRPPPAWAQTPARVHATTETTTHIPAGIRREIETKETAQVDVQALLAFCENVLNKFGELERRVGSELGAKIRALEAELRTRHLEVSGLRQQVEDLQLLVKVLEKR